MDGEPSAPAEPAAPDAELTGEPRVDAALAQLSGLPGLPVDEHADVFAELHERLSSVLGEVSAGPRRGEGARSAEGRPAGS